MDVPINFVDLSKDGTSCKFDALAVCQEGQKVVKWVQLKEAIPQILPKKARRPPVRLYCASAACMNGQHSGRVPKRLVVMGGHYRWKALTTRALRALNCTCHLHDLTDKTTACGGQRALVLHGSRQARHHVLCHVRVRDRPRLGVPHSVAEIGDAQPTPISALTVSLM